jgi:hypothetical protein
MRVSATTALCFTEFTVRLRGVIGDGFMASLVVVVAAVAPASTSDGKRKTHRRSGQRWVLKRVDYLNHHELFVPPQAFRAIRAAQTTQNGCIERARVPCRLLSMARRRFIRNVRLIIVAAPLVKRPSAISAVIGLHQARKANTKARH